MAWRLAKSLQVLENEVLGRWSGTTVWDIGDEAHRDTASDHNPNPAGVVCAIDVLGDGGMDLGWFAETVRTSGHPAAKYVIYNRRIASARSDPPWSWRPYSGDNPHTSHVHVSVGVGPDGRSTGPYDDESPWGLEEDQVDRADVNRVWNTDGIVEAPEGYDPDNTHWTAANVLRSAHLYSRLGADRAREALVLARAAAGEDVTAAVRDTIRTEFATLGPELAAELGDVPAERIEAALAKLRLVVDEG